MDNIFSWSDDFYTNIEIVDKQNMSLIEIINKITRISINIDEKSVRELNEIKPELTGYINAHFKTEEAMMSEYKLDKRHRAMHHKNHQLFKNDVANFLKDEKTFNKKKVINITNYLINWLAYHILNVDKMMARQIDHIKNGTAPEQAFEMEETITRNNSDPLLKALRAMFDIISEKNEQLEKANRELEDKVKERTIQLEMSNHKLKILSIQDELTGLMNRRYAQISISQQLAEMERNGDPVSILMIDADKFKPINDNYGHDYGDLVIKWIADHLTGIIRKEDIACRLGGDEFVIVCPNTRIDGAFKLGSKIVNTGSESFEINGVSCWQPSLSIGVAEASNDDTTESLLKKADIAMYKTKEKGGSGVSK